MKHLGDITKINWAEVEPVDCVTGGSPCQDLSVAGKRAGLAGKRSGLYMEQIRCVKELREQDVRNGRTGKFIRPRYMVWENVPGAFSSNGGKDFAAVLEEAVKIAEPEASDVPVPEKGWPSAGCLYDEMGRWSVAWRVHDAQFWGVPQRRKRISLVCDFGGMSAPEVLFERKGLSGDFEQSAAEGQEAAGDAESCPGTADSEGNSVSVLTPWDSQGNQVNDGTENHTYPCLRGCGGAGYQQGYVLAAEGTKCYGISSYASNAMKSSNPNSGIYEATTSRTPDLNGGSPACNQGGIAVVQDIKCYDMDNERRRGPDEFENVSPALTARAGTGGNNVPCVSFAAGGFGKYEEGVGTLRASGGDYGGGTETLVKTAVVRRLTPTECERLQGYPDGWTDIGEWVDSKGKRHKEADSPRYKALGNSIALPFWKWLLKRISAQYERDATLGSLFDGIGGFPLCWEQINGKGSARWASEIEEFPMAVTRKRFGNDQL